MKKQQIICALLAVALPGWLLPATPAEEASELYCLNESDVIVTPGAARTFVFEGSHLPRGARPVLWLAPRIVYVGEGRTRAVLSIEVNGTAIGSSRLIAESKTFRMPGSISYPIREEQKCVETNNTVRWRVRLDDNFIVGETDFCNTRRWFATENLEPGYAFDLTGLLKKGKNRLVIVNDYPAKLMKEEKGLTYPADPIIALFALHLKFLRIGRIPLEQIAQYNQTHTMPFAPRPRTFNILDRGEFNPMVAYYTRAAQQADSAGKRAFLQCILGCFQLWKGDLTAADRLLRDALQNDPQGERAAQTLFLLGVAQSRQGKAEAALQTWDQLHEGHPATTWADASRREAAIVSWKGKPAPINWPVLRAGRVQQPLELDGKLEETAWTNAPAASEFCAYPDKYLRPSVSTVARVLYDDRYIYLGVVCYEPFMREVVNPHQQRDSAVWDDDCVEFFFDPARNYVQAFEFELGAEGGIVDCLNVWDIAYMGYNPARIDKVAKYPDRWSLEMAIPWEALNVKPPVPGDVWLCNVARNRAGGEHRSAEAAVLGPATFMFAAPEAAALLIFE